MPLSRHSVGTYQETGSHAIDQEAGHGPPSAMAVQCRERNANPKFNFRRHLQRGNPPPNTRRLQPVADKKVLMLKRPQVSEIIITITVEE